MTDPIQDYYEHLRERSQVVKWIGENGAQCEEAVHRNTIKAIREATVREVVAHFRDACRIAQSDRNRAIWSLVADEIESNFLSAPAEPPFQGLRDMIENQIGEPPEVSRYVQEHLGELLESTPPAAEWPECSGDPADCPENEGYGCCKPNPPAAEGYKGPGYGLDHAAPTASLTSANTDAAPAEPRSISDPCEHGNPNAYCTECEGEKQVTPLDAVRRARGSSRPPTQPITFSAPAAEVCEYTGPEESCSGGVMVYHHYCDGLNRYSMLPDDGVCPHCKLPVRIKPLAGEE